MLVRKCKGKKKRKAIETVCASWKHEAQGNLVDCQLARARGDPVHGNHADVSRRESHWALQEEKVIVGPRTGKKVQTLDLVVGCVWAANGAGSAGLFGPNPWPAGLVVGP